MMNVPLIPVIPNDRPIAGDLEPRFRAAVHMAPKRGSMSRLRFASACME